MDELALSYVIKTWLEMYQYKLIRECYSTRDGKWVTITDNVYLICEILMTLFIVID